MEKDKIYLIGEKLMMGELDDVIRVSYPEKTPPEYCIVELENGTKLKLTILELRAVHTKPNSHLFGQFCVIQR